MENRTFRLNGIGYANEPMTITAKLDGAVIYSGPIPNDPDGPPELPDPLIHLGSPMFTWTADSSFSGSWTLELQVTNAANFAGYMYVTMVEANDILIPDPEDPDLWIPGGPTVFGACFTEVHTDEQGEYICSQAVTDIFVDGVPTGAHSTRAWPGQPGTLLRPQQIMTAVIHTKPAFVY